MYRKHCIKLVREMYCQIFRQIVCRAIRQTLCSVAVSKAIPHKDCATDASSNFSSDETKSGVNTGCIHEHFCEIWESVSYLTYADCVVRFFERWREKRRKSFVDFRVFSRNISENMHARCVREDTKQALKGNLQADGVQSRQTLFVRYCLRKHLQKQCWFTWWSELQSFRRKQFPVPPV